MIKNLLENQNYFGQTIHHLNKKYFNDQGSGLIFETIKNHYITFNSIPTLKDVILSNKQSTKQNKELIKDTIKQMRELKDETVEYELLIKQTELFIKDSIFTESLIMGADAMGENNQDKKLKSFQLAEESVKISLESDFGTFVEDIDKRFQDYLPKNGLKTNMPSFDSVIGDGYMPKTLHLIAAASGVGKSAMLCSFAVEFLKQKRDVIIISLEMAESEFYKRIDSNLLSTKIYKLQNSKEKLKNEYNKIKDHIGQLVVKEYPAGGLSPLGLQNYIEKLKVERGIKEPVVMVDYLSLIRSDRMTNSDNSYGYYKSVAEELRAVAQKLNLILFTPVQLNRGAIANLEADQSSISDSMGTFMTADSVFIISQTPQYKEEKKMRISYVKNRMSGITTFFEIGYDYEHFRVQENQNAQPEPVSFSGMDELKNLGFS